MGRGPSFNPLDFNFTLPGGSRANSVLVDVNDFLHFEEGATMRMMVRFTLPVEKGNQAFKDGSLAKTVESMMKKFKPEAAYFAPSHGKRGGVMFFDLAEPSQIIEVAEPLFSNLHAEVEIVPVMNADDLRKGIGKMNAK